MRYNTLNEIKGYFWEFLSFAEKVGIVGGTSGMQPELLVELRRGGTSQDSTPW